MKRDVSVEAKKAQFMVEKAMDDITRATCKVLMDYVSRMYVMWTPALGRFFINLENTVDNRQHFCYNSRHEN